MVDLEAIPAETVERIAAVGPVGAVVGLADCANAAALRQAVDALRAAQPEPLRTLLLYPDTAGDLQNGDLAAAAGTSLALVPFPARRAELSPQTLGAEPQTVLAIASATLNLQAKACFVWTSAAETLTPDTARWFLQPIVNGDYDMALPRYTQPRFGTLINSAITAPLTRTLYGQRVPYPMAPDLSFTPRLAEELVRPDPKTGRPRPPQWISIQAVMQGLRLCLVEVPAPPPSLAGSGDLSSVLSLVLGSLFQDVEKNASFWQRTRGSRALPRLGQAGQAEEHRDFEVHSLIEGFHLAVRNLGDIWGPVLPPATLLELKKMTRLSEAEFRMADTTWARIVFDFVLAQRQRVMNRDHLLRALTPLYLAWVASYALAIGAAPAAHAANRLEQLAQAYEAHKPYLLSRWRWPDRFNP